MSRGSDSGRTCSAPHCSRRIAGGTAFRPWAFRPCIALHAIGAGLAARYVPTFRSGIVQVNPMSSL